MLSNVKYQRDGRQYQVIDPQSDAVEFFPAGWHGRREAMRCAIQFQSPRLHVLATELASRWPQLESRSWRAAELVIRGAVKVSSSEDGFLAAVDSSNEYGAYLLKARDKIITCECIDYMDGSAPFVGPSGQRLCKHILAMQFARQLQSRICGSCGRKVDAELFTCVHCGGEITPY